MTTRFDLEQSIMNCWGITEDLNTLYAAVMDSNISKDTIANILLGTSQMYQLKFEKLFSDFEKTLHGKA